RKILLESLKKTPRLVVNMLEVRYVDSSGIASLVEVLKEARNKQKRLVLYGLNAAVHEALQLTRLTKIFEIRETEEEALQALGHTAQPWPILLPPRRLFSLEISPSLPRR